MPPKQISGEVTLILLITYDLNKPGQDYPGLYEALKSSGWWWHHLDPLWIVKTNDSPKSWYENTLILDKNDNVFHRIEKALFRMPTQEAWDWLTKAWATSSYEPNRKLLRTGDPRGIHQSAEP